MKRLFCFLLIFCLMGTCGCSLFPEEPPSTQATVPSTAAPTEEVITEPLTEATEVTVPETTEAPTIPTGWLEEDGERYYRLEDGTLATGPVTIDGVTYYFSSAGRHVLLVNRQNPVPEGYVPVLAALDPSVGEPGCYVDESCYDALVQLITDCNTINGSEMCVTSAYRFPEQQERIFDKKVDSYLKDGYHYDDAYAKAATAVAIPGTSEHQLGLAVDINDEDPWPTKPEHEQQIKPETLAAQNWLMANCWKYGFILRYPEHKEDVTGFIYEPWHYRYVGLALAEELYVLDLTLEEYMNGLIFTP